MAETDKLDIIINKMSELSGRITALESGQHITPQVQHSGNGMEAKPYKPSHFDISQMSDDREEIYCPTCGGFERRKIPIKEKEVIKEVEKPVPPDNWMPVPSKFDDIAKILNDMEHPDNHKLWDCPHCAPKFTALLEQHGYKQVTKK